MSHRPLASPHPTSAGFLNCSYRLTNNGMDVRLWSCQGSGFHLRPHVGYPSGCKLLKPMCSVSCSFRFVGCYRIVTGELDQTHRWSATAKVFMRECPVSEVSELSGVHRLEEGAQRGITAGCNSFAFHTPKSQEFLRTRHRKLDTQYERLGG